MFNYKKWLKQAYRDLEVAKYNLEKEYYEYACFLAQQSAEKAVKALCEVLNIGCFGHSIRRILKSLEKYGIEINKEILDMAKILDRYYITTRYPNGFEDAPFEYFTRSDAMFAIKYAKKILEFVENEINKRIK